jgi:hypothetical protein
MMVKGGVKKHLRAIRAGMPVSEGIPSLWFDVGDDSYWVDIGDDVATFVGATEFVPQ